jgi:urea transporter/murein DD-endopeptidase MepM/ murein hydrolase activator NlpD
MHYFIDSILYSYAQIFFSNRKWFGLTVMIASAFVPSVGMMALFGVVISNAIAIYLKFDRKKIRNGFYGFNGLLFGAASVFYFNLDFFLLFIIILFIIITFFISSVLEHYMAAAFNLPGLSLPFIISLFIFIIFLGNYDAYAYKALTFEAYFFPEYLPQSVLNYFRSLAFIILSNNIITGILLAAVILVFSRSMFLVSVIAFASNYFFVDLFEFESESFLLISGFNSILTAFALGGSLILISRKTIFLVILANVIIIIFTGFFIKVISPVHLPVLVLPFNFVVLSVLYALKFRQEHSDLVLLYFPPGSPEENLYYHLSRKERFDRFKLKFPELPFFGEWYVPQGYDGEYTHQEKWRYAWDFVVHDKEKSEYKDEGKKTSDYYCYRLPVTAPLDGKVAKVIDGVEDNEPGDMNLEQNWGNTVIIYHAAGLYSAVSHLQKKSIKVAPGDDVKKGQLIANCGNSGRSPSPHIHFQFQATDKLGDSTIKNPLAFFIETKDGQLILKNFDIPEAGTYVQNLETHRELKKAFDFKYGEKYRFAVEGSSKLEEWEVKADIYNLYIENNNGDTAILYQPEKMFYVISYTGKKNSALYYFYLLSAQVPLSYHKNLRWKDTFPIAQLMNNATRYIAEFLILFNQKITAYSEFTFPDTEGQNNYVITSSIEIKGTGLIDFYRKNWRGNLTISKEGVITEMYFEKSDKEKFKATLIQE